MPDTDNPTMPLKGYDEARERTALAHTRQWALDKAIQIAEINHTAEINRIISDANRIFNFYQKGTLPE